MKNKIQGRGGSFWNFIFSLILVFLAIYISYKIFETNSDLIVNLGFFEFFVISLATFRLIRFFTYDKIMNFLRDFFAMRKSKFMLTIHELLICPWCTGIWLALLVIALYLLIPLGKILVFILAIAGAGSLIQIFANMIGRLGKK